MSGNERKESLSSTSASLGGALVPQPSRITLAEARRKALRDSERAEQAQIVYAEEEANRWHDYRVEE